MARWCWLAAAVGALCVGCGDGGGEVTSDGGTGLDAGLVPYLVITTQELPDGRVQVNYAASVRTMGGLRPIAWRVSEGSLPPGLDLDAATGAISGTPTLQGQYGVTIEVRDESTPPQIVTESYTVDIDPPPGPLSIATTSLPAAQVGVPYSASLQAAGGAPPYAWSVSEGALPSGIALGVLSGELEGTPTLPGLVTFTVRVIDSVTPSQVATAVLSIEVALPPTLEITTASLPAGEVGVSYTTTFSATGGVPPYFWSISQGTLPAGLAVTPATGVVEGIPTTEGTVDFTARVVDSFSTPQQAIKPLQIVIAPGQQHDAGTPDAPSDAAPDAPPDAAQEDAAQEDAQQDAQEDVLQQDAQEDAQEDAQQDAQEDV